MGTTDADSAALYMTAIMQEKLLLCCLFCV